MGATIRGEHEGPHFSPMGTAIAFRATADDTAGAFSLYDYTAPPGFGGPPHHVHAEHDEVFYVIEGTLRVRLDDEQRDVAAGSVVIVPRGVAHGFSNATDRPTRFIGTVSPGGFEHYFEGLTQLLAESSPPDPEKVMTLAAKFDTQPAPPLGDA